MAPSRKIGGWRMTGSAGTAKGVASGGPEATEIIFLERRGSPRERINPKRVLTEGWRISLLRSISGSVLTRKFLVKRTDRRGILNKETVRDRLNKGFPC